MVSVRVMRQVSRRLVLCLSGTRKLLELGKNAGTDPFCIVDGGTRLLFHEKVAVSRTRARLGASTAITKKEWCLYVCTRVA